MDTQGFKFTFYFQPFEPKSENFYEGAQVKTATSRNLMKNRPILGQILNQNTTSKSYRPTTQRNTRVVIRNPCSESLKSKDRNPDLPRSQSYLHNLRTVENADNFLQKRNPKSCNILRLLPVLHHHKKHSHHPDLFVHSIKLRLPSTAL